MKICPFNQFLTDFTCVLKQVTRFRVNNQFITKEYEADTKYVYHQFLSISSCINSEYWSQKCTQNGDIHSTDLDVYVEKQSASNFSFIEK